MRTRVDYYTVLHEFGHLACWPVGAPLYDEATAWRWALDHAELAPTLRVLQMIDGCMLDYWGFRLAFDTYDEARSALPEHLRPAVDNLLAALGPMMREA